MYSTHHGKKESRYKNQIRYNTSIIYFGLHLEITILFKTCACQALKYHILQKAALLRMVCIEV